MKRVLYHGSETIIEKPSFGEGNIHNDYGLGFYCTSNKTLAKEWATRKNGRGFVNAYSIRDDRLSVLDLTKGEENNALVWIALLMKNRTISNELRNNYPRELEFLFENYLIDVSEYDAVIGYRADDAYFRFPEAFVRSDITLESMERIYKAGNLGKQYVIVSERAFNLLHFSEASEAGEAERAAYFSRKQTADKEFFSLIQEDRYKSGTRLIDLVRK